MRTQALQEGSAQLSRLGNSVDHRLSLVEASQVIDTHFSRVS